MDNFLTWDVILTYSGCIAGTVLLTEWLKKIFQKIPTQLTSFIIAALVLIIGHLATATFTFQELPLYLINAVAVSLASNGGFDAIKNTFGNNGNTTDGELVFTKEDDGEPYLYANLGREPDHYEDGETVTFKIVKSSQE